MFINGMYFTHKKKLNPARQTVTGRISNKRIERDGGEQLSSSQAQWPPPLMLIVRRDGLAGRNYKGEHENEEKIIGRIGVWGNDAWNGWGGEC